MDSCGARTYQIVEQGDNTFTPVPYARVEEVIANTNFKIVSDYTNENYEGEHDLSLYVTMTNYPVASEASHPKLQSNFKLTITKPSCDCKLLDWDNP